MTISTLLRSRCVKKYGRAIYYTVEFVAVGAAAFAVGLSKREGRLFVVVEERWLPARAAMTLTAPGDASRLRELRSMNVGVTLFALRWRGVEISTSELGS
jgi:hypothetical protein